MNENFLRTIPPHAIIMSKDFNKLDLSAFRHKTPKDTALAPFKSIQNLNRIETTSFLRLGVQFFVKVDIFSPSSVFPIVYIFPVYFSMGAV
jgi:hypothetical protein